MLYLSWCCFLVLVSMQYWSTIWLAIVQYTVVHKLSFQTKCFNTIKAFSTYSIYTIHAWEEAAHSHTLLRLVSSVFFLPSFLSSSKKCVPLVLFTMLQQNPHTKSSGRQKQPIQKQKLEYKSLFNQVSGYQSGRRLAKVYLLPFSTCLISFLGQNRPPSGFL